MTKHLLSGHAQFRAAYFHERDFIRRLHTEGQKPKALYIGCSDSRVVPELLTGSDLGDIFVVRNVGNFVPTKEHHDLSVGAAIEFAVDHLKVPDIIVCGHYSCGGVKAACSDFSSSRPQSELAAWVQSIGVPAVKQAGSHESAVEENVLAALENLLTYPEVLEAASKGALHIHGWIYDTESGRIFAYDEESEEFVDALRLRS